MFIHVFKRNRQALLLANKMVNYTKIFVRNTAQFELENHEHELRFAMRLNEHYGYIEYTQDGDDYDLVHLTFPEQYEDKGLREMMCKKVFNYILVQKKQNLKITNEVIANYFKKYQDTVDKKLVEPEPTKEKPPRPLEDLKQDELKLVNHVERNVFVARLNSSIAFLQYKKHDNLYNILYIMVPSQYRGSGIGTKLAIKVFDYIEKEGAQMIISCGFVKAVFKKHESRYSHLLGNQKTLSLSLNNVKIKPKEKSARDKDIVDNKDANKVTFVVKKDED